MPDLLAIIPFYKRRDQLDRCLAALAGSAHPIAPWIHDNSTNNLGFTKAINLGLVAALRDGCEFALLLNQDCYVNADTVGHLLAFMRSHPDCGICGPKQLLDSNPDVIVHGGCAEAYPSGEHLVGVASLGDYTVSRRMPWVCGSAMFVRMAMVREIGLMDRNMFLCGSDSDWCYTARARGWSVWYCAEAQCLHEVGVTFQNASPELHPIIKRDGEYWRDKWVGSTLYARLAGERFPLP